jgi:hypothetical protein
MLELKEIANTTGLWAAWSDYLEWMIFTYKARLFAGKYVFFGKWILGKWISEKYFLIFSSVMENKLENTFQCLVMSWKMSWKITY